MADRTALCDTNYKKQQVLQYQKKLQTKTQGHFAKMNDLNDYAFYIKPPLSVWNIANTQSLNLFACYDRINDKHTQKEVDSFPCTSYF